MIKILDYQMEDEIEKFQNRAQKIREDKLLIDFNSLNHEFEKKQIDLGFIKYKESKKNLQRKFVDLKKRKNSPSDLF